jgi:hypothetical protein
MASSAFSKVDQGNGGRRFCYAPVRCRYVCTSTWRLPVKSMRGEKLTEATLQVSGIKGDRNIMVVSKPRNTIIMAASAVYVGSKQLAAMGTHSGAAL